LIIAYGVSMPRSVPDCWASMKRQECKQVHEVRYRKAINLLDSLPKTTESKKSKSGLDIAFDAVTNNSHSIHKCKKRLFGDKYIEEDFVNDDSRDEAEDVLEEDDYDSDDTETYIREEEEQRMRGKRLLLERDTEYEHLARELEANDT
jgi:hypothetical protein